MSGRSEEPSARTAFTGSPLMRSSEKRADDAIDQARADPATRWFVMLDGRIALRQEGSEPPQPLFDTDDLTRFEPDFSEAILLGFADGAAVCAVPCGQDPDTLAEPCKALDLRSIYAQGLTERGILSMLAQAAALQSWHKTHKHCGRCGGLNRMASAGVKRICAECAAEHFPRTDPVVIMLTVRGDLCLLARGPNFPVGMVSCLAGFMEPGESIEEAVRRETLEEAGISTGKVTYHASQPWPFPHSLMIGCYGEATSENIALDHAEIESGRWFSRTEVLEMLDNDHPEGWRLPPPGAIATLLIADWARS